MKDENKTANRSHLINLVSKMIERYQSGNNSSHKCLICSYFHVQMDWVNYSGCIDCFNRIISKENDNYQITCGCVAMKTFGYDDYRLVYWKMVLDYLNSLTSEEVFLGQLRYKCNEIDQKLI